MYKTSLLNYKAFTIIAAVLIMSSCFAIDKSLFNGVIVSKTIWVQAFSVISIIILVVKGLFTKEIHIKMLDLLVTAICIWMVVRELFSQMPYANPNYVLNIVIYYGIYLLFRNISNNSKAIELIIVTYLIIVSIQSIIGLLQLYGILTSYHALYNITGTFHNPGPFSGFIVSGLPMAVTLYLITKSNSKDKSNDNGKPKLIKSILAGYWSLVSTQKLLNYFAKFVIIILLLVLPLTHSRAAWLSGLLGLLYVSYHFKLHYKLKQVNNIFTKARFSRSFRKAFISIVILIIILSLIWLYKYKQSSADGRILMWQVTWEMIKDKPIIGWGQGGFEACYSNFQAEWFKTGKGNQEQEMVAGNPDAPFNEVIRIIVAYGFIGFILIIFSIVEALKGKVSLSSRHAIIRYGQLVLFKGAVISIVTFSLFSYPLDIAPILIQFVILIAMLVNEKKGLNIVIRYHYQRFIIVMLLICLSGCSYFLFTDTLNKYNGYKYWNEAYDLYKYQIYDDSIYEYEEALKLIPKQGLLLQMYGKCMVMDSQWEKAIKVLEEAKILRSSPILMTALGDSYRELKKIDKAEESYLQAYYMVPHKFYPKYKLVKMYYEIGEYNKAKKLAYELLQKEVKVNSKAISEIKEELLKILDGIEEGGEI